MMAGYIRSKGQVLNRSQIRESLQRQRINPTDHQRRRADSTYNAAYYGHQNEKLSRYGCTLFAFKFQPCMDAVPK